MPAKYVLLFASIIAPALPIPFAQDSYSASGTRVQLEKFTLVRLERTECFGSCPVYTVTISGDGAVEYQGNQYVKVVGTASGRLPGPALVQLVGALNAADVFSLRDQYTSEEDGCVSIATCNPSATITVIAGGRSKTIRHYYGCRADFGAREPYPAQLVNLARAIDAIAGTEQWIGTPEERRLLSVRGNS